MCSVFTADGQAFVKSWFAPMKTKKISFTVQIVNNLAASSRKTIDNNGEVSGKG